MPTSYAYQLTFTQDIDKKPELRRLQDRFFMTDSEADTFVIQVTRDGSPFAIPNSIVAHLLMADNTELVWSGSVEQQYEVHVTLPAEAYAVPGQSRLTIQLVNDSEKIPLFCADMFISRNASAVQVVPAGAVPDLSRLLAVVERAEAAAEDAEAAAASAVRFDQDQSLLLTDAQKATARGNISAPSQADMTGLQNTVNGLSNVFQYIQEDITDLNTDVDGLKSATRNEIAGTNLPNGYVSNPIDMMITKPNKWGGSGQANHVMIPIFPGDSIEIRSNPQQPAIFAILTDYDTPVNDATPKFSQASGFTARIELQKNTTETYIAPSDARYISFNFQYSGNSYYPAGIKVNGISLKYSAVVDIRSRVTALETTSSGLTDDVSSLQQQNVIDETALTCEWEQGSLDGFGADTTQNPGRVRTDYIDVSAYNYLSVSVDADYRVYWFAFSATKVRQNFGGWIDGASSFTVDITMAAYVRFMFVKSDNTTTAPADAVAHLAATVSMADKDVIYRALKASKRNDVFHALMSPANSARYIFGKGKMWEALWNTAEAYELAGQDDRCWAIDGDVQYTSDNKLVMYHDRDIPFGSGDIIKNMTLAEVQAVDLTQSGDSTVYHAPTFDTFVQTCRKYGKVCCIELKGPAASGSQWASPGGWVNNGKSSLLDEMIQSLYAYGMQDGAFFLVSSVDDLFYIRNNYPDVMCCIALDANVTEINVQRYINDPNVLLAGYADNWVSNNTIGLAHGAGLKIITYSTRPQTNSMIDAMKAINADGVVLYADPDN